MDMTPEYENEKLRLLMVIASQIERIADVLVSLEKRLTDQETD